MAEWFEEQHGGAAALHRSPGESWTEDTPVQRWDGCSWWEKPSLTLASDCWCGGEMAREWPVKEVPLPRLPKEIKPRPPQVVPDIQNGLGKSQAKQDFAKLEEVLIGSNDWAVQDGVLCLYKKPRWVRLGPQSGVVEIRRCLSELYGQIFLNYSDYREIYHLLTINPQLQAEGIFRPSKLSLNLADKTLDVLTGEVRDHDPGDGFFSYLDMTLYELVESRSTGAFERFADQISNGDPDVRRQLLELVGISLLGCELKYFFVLVGPSHTGKSQFGRFLTELVGREYVETLRDANDFNDKWSVGALRGKRLATCLDLPNAPLSSRAVGMIKQLVGDDAVKGEYKGGALFTFYEKPLLLFAGNYPLRVPNMAKEEALLNRMVVIPCYNPVSAGEEKQHFYEVLLEDSPYIVRCALEAFRDLEKRNFRITRARVPKEFAAQEGNDALKSVLAFLCTSCVSEEGAEVATSQLRERYREFEDSIELSSIDFARQLHAAIQIYAPAAYPSKRVSGMEQRGYCGLKLGAAEEETT